MHSYLSFITAGAIAALVTLPAPATAQGAFEGVVTFQMNAGPQGNQTMQYSAKNGKARWDISMPGAGGEMFVLMKDGGKTMDMVVPSQQMYMERSGADIVAMADSAADNAKIKWTGKKETVAGYECEHATITDKDGTSTDACLAKGLGQFMGMGGAPGGRGSMSGAWQGHLGQMFPLKIEHQGQLVLQATKIEKQSLDDAIFQIPSGFQKMSMPGGR